MRTITSNLNYYNHTNNFYRETIDNSNNSSFNSKAHYYI